MMSFKTLVFIPTFNEKENVEQICAKLLELKLGLDILFLDDNSPDGTGDILDDLARRHKEVRVIHRRRKSGVGSAHQEGIRWAYDHGYQTLLTMDCDFTHPPRYIPDFLDKARDHDVVVGSRYLRKDSLREWNLFRWFLTNVGHFLTTYLLKMPYDATGAYRLYRLDKIPAQGFELVQSKGYSFFFESLYILHLNRFRIKEVAITLPARTYGHSKMRPTDALHSVNFLLHLYLTQWINREKLLASDPFVPNGRGGSVERNAEWDEYWMKQKGAGGMIFDLIAAFYRKYIIRRTLNQFIREQFKPGAVLLHAGCGGGQVDADISRDMRITALDISPRALTMYKKANGGRGALLHGSLFNIPLDAGSVDGVYNLGVMEHFPEPELRRILKEFHRVLRPGGKMVLFWPPEFGLSVIALRAAHYALNRILKKNVKLHPDEIVRVKSKRHVRSILENADFRMTRYYFGPKDFFTHSIIVASKN